MFFLALALVTPIVLHDDGGWCWFEDERAIVKDGKLLFGVVASGRNDPSRAGNIEAISYDLKSGARQVSVLHTSTTPEDRKRWLDDHNSPAFLALPNGNVIAMYARHGNEASIYWRIFEKNQWGEERTFKPSESSRVTYSNLFYLSAEKRVFDFFRGLNNSFKPSFMYSDDMGESWKTGNVFIDVPTQFRHRPYVKYTSNNVDTVHMAYTDGHPRDFDNSIYHVFYRGGNLHSSDGRVLRPLSEGLKKPEEGTLVFKGSKEKVAWISDVHLDPKGGPVLVFSEQREPGGDDLRYHYARWDGAKWIEHEIAYAGSKLYRGEDDYTGNIALDPQSLDTVYISTNADPVNGTKLTHYEIYRGKTRDGGAHWTWTPLTQDSTADNIRPIVPVWKDSRVAVLWLRGKMRTYTDYSFEVVGHFAKR